jgi:hypothetical protein
MADADRKTERHIASYLNEALARDAGALVTVAGAMKPVYVATPVNLTAIENDPNTTAPAASRIILAGDLDETKVVTKVALYAVYTGAAGATSFRVWVRSGLAAPAWIPIQIVTFAGTTADTEQVINVGNRSVFIQALTGVNITPVNLYYAVA